METVKRQNLSEIIAGRIKHFIIANELKPGDRLPTEHEMAARFGVSRVSVREATKALGFLGVLRAAPRRGLTVGEFDLQRATEQLGFPLVLAEHPKKQLLQTRIVIETGALPDVAERMAENPALYDQLAALTDPQQAEATTLDERIAADLAFHRALLAASGLGPWWPSAICCRSFSIAFARPSPAQPERGCKGICNHRFAESGDVDAATAELPRRSRLLRPVRKLGGRTASAGGNAPCRSVG